MFSVIICILFLNVLSHSTKQPLGWKYVIFPVPPISEPPPEIFPPNKGREVGAVKLAQVHRTHRGIAPCPDRALQRRESPRPSREVTHMQKGSPPATFSGFPSWVPISPETSRNERAVAASSVRQVDAALR